MTGDELEAMLRQAEAEDDWMMQLRVLQAAAGDGIWDAATTWRRIATIYDEQLADPDEAVAALERALAAAPDDAEAAAHLARLRERRGD
jgi:tetratricopeptide (TPR) repeat protein